ncbi:PqqD family peptide modification chaperone [Mesobacterium pallidum]|uniref:PqqD family peptide modification chaperone n=1 Tax=Mesobacterium pallidum TaxID=2872037 RepID=UPI001EE23EDB|nr:PqqD family peptide modification chaperone [Mesobacterium pallidum]
MSAPTQDAPLFSPYWYKVEGIAPRLRPGVRVTRRVEQGEVWHILSAPETNRFFRLDAASYAIIGAFDGRQTLDAIWRRVLDRFGDGAPGQDETIRLLGQLHQADALNAGTAPSLAEFGHRARRMQRQKIVQKLKSPLFIRVPLFDPVRIINATYPFVRPLFSWVGLLLWLMAVTWLAVQAVTHWDTLSGAIIDRALAADNLLVAALVFPFAKALHEMAHGWAVRHWGGQVREFGIMFLVFLPAPYVDASEAAAFRSRRARLVVGGAGMMAEALLATLAMFVWLNAETGAATAIAFNTLLIAGVSTFLFNGNPLLRFDAYFMLSDLIGVQNLAGRSQKWWGWLLHAKLYGMDSWENPARTRSETWWFALYHPLSYAYRIFLTLSIALFVAQTYRVVGLALATWSVTSTIVLPIAQGVWHLVTNPRLTTNRRKAWGVTLLLVGIPAALLTLVPLPHGTVAPATVVAPDSARIAAPVQALITTRAVPSGAHVDGGAVLARLGAPLAENQLAVVEARLETANARLARFEADAATGDQAARTRAEIGYLAEEQAELQADLARLAVAADAPGRFLARPEIFVPGRGLSEGAELGFLLPDAARVDLRAAVPASRIDLVSAAPAAVTLLIPGRGFDALPATLTALAPEATRQLDHPGLSQAAGGPLVMDPSDENARRTAQPFHLAEITTDLAFSDVAVGQLVWVRFDHGLTPLAPRIWRAIRQTFLSRLAL